MTLNNQPSNVPAQVKQLFYSRIPFGSEYYIFTTSTGNVGGYVEYTMLLREIGEKTYDVYTVSRSSSSAPYVLSLSSENQAYTEISVSYPYYAYSSEGKQGIVEPLPAVDNMVCFCLMVISLLAVLKVVFGGVKWVSSKRSRAAF